MQQPKNYTVPEAIKKLERYCTYQERCHQDVVLKLKGMKMIPQAIDHVVTHLINENFLNEERFSRNFARGKFKIKKWGKNRIISELKRKQISQYNIKAALSEIDDDDYFTTIDELAKKRLSQISEINIQKRKRKLADYLLYRGWESHLVYSKIKELITS